VSKVITQGAQTAIELSYEHFPDTTKNTLDFIGKVGNGLEATVKYVDDKTGNVISAQWNELDKDTQNQIKGGGNILSVVVPIGSVRKIAGLRGAGSLGGGVGTKIFKVTKKTTKINYRSGKELNKLENKGNKSREDAWVNEENVIERKFDATCVWVVSTVSNNFAIFILHLSDLIITIIATGVLFIGNGYNYITMEMTSEIMLSLPQKTMAMAT
jgi:hypothetical protein